MAISSLGYIGITAHDPRQWLDLCTRDLGMMPARALPGESWGVPGDPADPGPKSAGCGVGPDGSVFLKMDEWQWRVAVHPADGAPGLAYLGFDADTKQGFEDLLSTLEAKGVDVEKCDGSQAAKRSVRELARLSDPAGNALEIFWGPTIDRKFISPHGHEFITGKLGFGHLNLFVSQLEACYDFYTEVLGFRLSDYLIIDADAGLSANFLHCNPRHHTVALTRVGDVRGVHHIMFQMENLDQVGKALTRVVKAGWTITSTLGRHVNDRMLSFYFRGPSGFDIEIGCEGLLLDDSWTPNQFCEGDVWGHEGLTPEAIAEMASELERRG
ncbi:MAG: VOC family protein [Sphingomonadaceae bacterium]|nr:VOC family protein [Sphingomonadaceae bacterium]